MLPFLYSSTSKPLKLKGETPERFFFLCVPFRRISWEVFFFFMHLRWNKMFAAVTAAKHAKSKHFLQLLLEELICFQPDKAVFKRLESNVRR